MQNEVKRFLVEHKSGFIKESLFFVTYGHAQVESYLDEFITSLIEQTKKPQLNHILKDVEAYAAISRGKEYLLKEAMFTSYFREILDILIKIEIDFSAHVEQNIAPKEQVNFKDQGEFMIHANVIDTCKNLMRDDINVNFFTLYQGLPFSSFGKVVRVEDEIVVFELEKDQVYAIEEDNVAYILSNDIFSKPLRADLVESNLYRNTITLKNFVYMRDMPASRRAYPRVHPEKLMPVRLTNLQNSSSIDGITFDISEGGLGVVSDKNCDIKNGAMVKLFFWLEIPSTKIRHEIEGEAQVLVVLKYDEESFRYCMQTNFSEAQKELIKQYTNDRQTQVLEDLRDDLLEYM